MKSRSMFRISQPIMSLEPIADDRTKIDIFYLLFTLAHIFSFRPISHSNFPPQSNIMVPVHTEIPL